MCCFKKVTRILFALAVVTFTISSRDARAAPILSVTNASVNAGDTFDVSITITDATDLTFWQFDLAFDAALLTATSVSEGTFMSSFGATSFVPGVIDNTSGLISLVSDAYIDLPPDPSGSGVIAMIEFEALQPGASPLVLSNAFLNLSDQGFSVVNGQVTVAASPNTVPEPGSLLLLGTALIALGARRSQRQTDEPIASSRGPRT
jgi:hypothetical protein